VYVWLFFFFFFFEKIALCDLLEAFNLRRRSHPGCPPEPPVAMLFPWTLPQDRQGTDFPLRRSDRVDLAFFSFPVGVSKLSYRRSFFPPTLASSGGDLVMALFLAWLGGCEAVFPPAGKSDPTDPRCFHSTFQSALLKFCRSLGGLWSEMGRSRPTFSSGPRRAVGRPTIQRLSVVFAAFLVHRPYTQAPPAGTLAGSLEDGVLLGQKTWGGKTTSEYHTRRALPQAD